MEGVSLKDKERLRSLAARKMEFANCKRNEEILKQWSALASGVKATPTVRLLFSNFRREVVDERLTCEGADARKLEAKLLSSMVGRELFDDDAPISESLEVNLVKKVKPFGASRRIVRAKGTNGYHIEPLTDDIEKDFHLFCGGSFSASLSDTKKYCDWVNEIIGDILPAKIVGAVHIREAFSPFQNRKDRFLLTFRIGCVTIKEDIDRKDEMI